ncbi:hypothetical protein MSP7336_02326 [Mycobacterium shimoidei]|uniref:Transmembrane protein n=1 Tax=Mycobacterium shimoidei TaxID=29313 RepID=A0A375YYV8_MYCSH|nr:hypothetical protein [Mycobacterium shimoidei]SRX94078.1 hypothetical protein MSP7336_02326 [Mycobacterium shimoidei]
MDARVITRGRLGMLIGAVLLAVGLIALSFPVYLDSYDRYGLQVKCGNGYVTQLLQATVDDHEQPPGAATHYVDECKSALLHRRVLTLPLTAAGTVILMAVLIAWMRAKSPNSAAPPCEQRPDHTEEEFHEAAVLDRRYRAHRPPPHDTTL